jgi:hypothetical protein
MKKRNPASKQTDFFAQDPERIQWQHLPLASRQKTESLLAKLFLCLSAHAIESQTKETSHAIENSF